MVKVAQSITKREIIAETWFSGNLAILTKKHQNSKNEPSIYILEQIRHSIRAYRSKLV